MTSSATRSGRLTGKCYETTLAGTGDTPQRPRVVNLETSCGKFLMNVSPSAGSGTSTFRN